jgi:cyclin D1/2/4
MLLCAEDNIDVMCFEEEEEEEEAAAGWKRRGRSPDADFGSDLFPPQTEECVAGLVEREPEHMPRADYGERLRAGGVDLRVRGEAVDWIWKVRSRLE